MKTNLKIFCGISIFAIIAVANITHAATTPVVNNKTSQFNDVLSEMGANATNSSNTELAETIRRQRALLDAQADKASAGGTSNITTSNACDSGLRKCMTEKCGADFTKCASDSTTVWGNKMDACRRNTKCTGHEYTLLAPEILADRNAAIELSYYNSVVNCGNKYNNCIFGICGKTLDKCLSKSAGDSAIIKCKSIADECKEYDNGLVGRISGVFGDLRTAATADAQKQEKRLYELRDLMRTQCTRFGAMFDERTLDCVYTVNFFAGEDSTLMASKKLYSGATFQCTPDWFGIDITTYMENAQRLTRSQKGASAAAMGAGLGTAASLWTSGAVTRGIDTQNAEKQAKEACIADGGEWVSAGFNQGMKCDMTKAIEKCKKEGGTWDDKTGCSGGNTGTPDGNNGNPNSSNGGGSNPGETPCEAYSNMSSYICESKNCEWNNTTKQCTKPNAQQNTKTDSSTGGGRNPADISDFKRPDAKGEEPTDKQLEDDKTGRICRRYYTDDWCTEYYNLYNKEKEANKAATKEQRQKRREEISNKLKTGFSNVTTKIGTGLSNAAKKVEGIFKKSAVVSEETEIMVNCGSYKTELICGSYDACWWNGQNCLSTNSSTLTNKDGSTYTAPNPKDSGSTKNYTPETDDSAGAGYYNKSNPGGGR